MRSSLVAATILASLAFSNPGLASGHHGVGAVGAVLNAIEAIKHGAVIVDQYAGKPKTRNYWVWAGNGAVVAGHIMQGWLQVNRPCCAHNKNSGSAPAQRNSIALPLFLLANGWTIVDLVVDGVTTKEYWQREGSLLADAAKFLAPLCIAVNLYSLQKMWRNS